MRGRKSKHRTVAMTVLWEHGPVKGRIEVGNGRLAGLRVVEGKGTVSQAKFAISSAGACRLEIAVADSVLGVGAGATIVSVVTPRNPLSFFLRDAVSLAPICVPDCSLAVARPNDRRSFEQIVKGVRRRGSVTSLQAVQNAPEETYDHAAAGTRDLPCPTWLGLGRDMQIFEFELRNFNHVLDCVTPRDHGPGVRLPECPDSDVYYEFLLGRGWGCTDVASRRLEDGILPILHGRLVDDEIAYEFTTFATLEKHPLAEGNVRGTHYLVADAHGWGNMQTEEQKKQASKLKEQELATGDQTVLYFRASAVNTSLAPRYAWFMAVGPRGMRDWTLNERGLGKLPKSGRVFAAHLLDGKPMPQKELAVLLGPGESAVYEFRLPHRPIDDQRGARLAGADFDSKRAQCREYWLKKLGRGASMRLPEPRINEMTRAGLLHLDLVAYGREPAEPIAATIGVYCPIGSESSPIMQYFDSMGWHDLAERALDFFLCKQKPDGFMQNFGNYMVETGPAMWSMGEHYRYTRDDAWARRVAPKVLKACDFMIAWRNRDATPDGYALAAGKVGDPEDPFHSFMLNGYAYMGISRAAEMLARVRPAESRRLAAEAKAYKRDIRAAFFQTIARGPVVPLGDGTWIPSCAPWMEDRGPVCLLTTLRPVYTHGSMVIRDIIGPLYLVFQEVLEADEQAASWLLKWQCDMMNTRNVAFCQPYYSRHPWVHLARGEVKAFLKTFYNGFAGLADRQTYTFWEHYFHASPHKTHEEAWFLMETRWMLYMEHGDTLRLLRGVPRAWLEDGKTIEVSKAATYFGPLSMKIESKLRDGCIEANVQCPERRRPRRLEIRLPHPQGLKASSVQGGVYHPDTETVHVDGFRGSARVVARF